MEDSKQNKLPIGTEALILSKLYYGALSKTLEGLDIERYYSVLYFLHDNNGCCQQVICDNLNVDKTAMVKMIDYLCKADFVERRINPKDRREHFIFLSKEGEKKTKQIVKAFEHIDEQAFAGISENDQKKFTQMLLTICENLKALPSNDLFFNYKKTR